MTAQSDATHQPSLQTQPEQNAAQVSQTTKTRIVKRKKAKTPLHQNKHESHQSPADVPGERLIDGLFHLFFFLLSVLFSDD